MTRRGVRAAWTVLAVLLVLILLWLAISRHVYYRTLPSRLLDRLFTEDDADTARVVLRKFYSIVAFTVLGFVADKALPRRGNRALRAALVVAGFSAVIEVGQRLHGSTESFASNIFDVGCGALGGWLGTVTAQLAGDRRRPRRRNENAREP